MGWGLFREIGNPFAGLQDVRIRRGKTPKIDHVKEGIAAAREGRGGEALQHLFKAKGGKERYKLATELAAIGGANGDIIGVSGLSTFGGLTGMDINVPALKALIQMRQLPEFQTPEMRERLEKRIAQVQGFIDNTNAKRRK